jgi:hypothetical protein
VRGPAPTSGPKGVIVGRRRVPTGAHGRPPRRERRRRELPASSIHERLTKRRAGSPFPLRRHVTTLRGGDQPVVFPSLFVRARKKYVFPFAQLAAHDARRVHGLRGHRAGLLSAGLILSRSGSAPAGWFSPGPHASGMDEIPSHRSREGIVVRRPRSTRLPPPVGSGLGLLGPARSYGTLLFRGNCCWRRRVGSGRSYSRVRYLRSIQVPARVDRRSKSRQCGTRISPLGPGH